MGARQKLNSIYLKLALVFATFAGLLTQSAIVFCVALALLILVNINSGAIRPDNRRQ